MSCSDLEQPHGLQRVELSHLCSVVLCGLSTVISFPTTYLQKEVLVTVRTICTKHIASSWNAKYVHSRISCIVFGETVFRVGGSVRRPLEPEKGSEGGVL